MRGRCPLCRGVKQVLRRHNCLCISPDQMLDLGLNRCDGLSGTLLCCLPTDGPGLLMHSSSCLYRRVLFTTATAFICWTVFYVIVLEPLFDWAEDEWDALSEKEKQELSDESDEGADSILFLPMPFSTIEVKQKPYKNDDPNWLEFVAFNRSPQAREDVKCL